MAAGLDVLSEVKAVVGSALGVRDRIRNADGSTALLGAIPELDSIAVVNLITALEEHFGFSVADDELGAATFETLGSLAGFVEGEACPDSDACGRVVFSD